MNIVTPSEMEEIDRSTIEEYGLASLVLMENAARSVLEYLPEGRTGILVGPGNNGGDGLVLARVLQEQGRPVKALLLSDKLSPDADKNLALARNWGVECQDCTTSQQEEAIPSFLAGSDLVVDALFGTGLDRPLEGRWRRLVEFTNASEAQVTAIDIPSGVHGKTGQILGAAIKAQQTITFGCLKRGQLLHPGKEHCGTVRLTQPGFHPLALAKHSRIKLFGAEIARKTLPKPWPTMHKGDNGRVLMITGSTTYPGAGLISTLGTLRAGAGLVTHYLPEQLVASLMQMSPEAMPRSRKLSLSFEGFNSVVVGCGLGDEAQTLGREVLEKSPLPTVVDADCLAVLKQVAPSRRERFVLTPHPGELARLLDKSPSLLEQDRIGAALEAAQTLECVVCFKGAPTVTASPTGLAYVNSSGNSVLAQGGTGDLLAGVIGAYLAYGLPLLEAAAAGAYIHGLAADLAGKKIGLRGVTASQIAELVPFAYSSVVGNP